MSTGFPSVVGKNRRKLSQFYCGDVLVKIRQRHKVYSHRKRPFIEIAGLKLMYCLHIFDPIVCNKYSNSVSDIRKNLSPPLQYICFQDSVCLDCPFFNLLSDHHHCTVCHFAESVRLRIFFYLKILF